MALTQEQVKDYIEDGGYYCPQCKSENLDNGLMNIYVGISRISVSCKECGEEWTNEYTLTGIINYEVVKEDTMEVKVNIYVTCPQCNNDAKKVLTNLTEEIKIHTGDFENQDWTCEWCGKVFKSGKLKISMRDTNK